MALNEKLQALAAFEDAADISATAQYLGHHSLQMRFAKDVLSVVSVLRPRNPFLPHNGPDLVTLHTREVMPSAIAQTLCNAYNRGKDLHDAFVSDRLRNGRVAITDTVKRSALQTFARRTDDSMNRSKVIALRKDISLVSTLFLSLQSRPDFDLDNFFKCENQKEPPSLSDQGKLRFGTTSDVLRCLTIPKLTPPDDVTVKVLECPAVVHMVRPTYRTNYQQYVVRHFMPFITTSLTNLTSRLDIIWDIYPDNNNSNNNSNFVCANILENQAQWRDKTRGFINLIIESNAWVVNGWMEKLGG